MSESINELAETPEEAQESAGEAQESAGEAQESAGEAQESAGEAPTEQIQVPGMEVSNGCLKVWHFVAKENLMAPAYIKISEITAIVQVNQELVEIVVGSGPLSLLVVYPVDQIARVVYGD